MTRYIAAYDTEKPQDCLTACQQIRAVHEQFSFPGTFFIVGKRLEDEGEGYRAVLGDVPEFEIASHTYSHKMLRDHPFCGPAPAQLTRDEELRLGKERIEQTFQRACVGLRPGCGFAEGLRGDTWLTAAVADTGFRYVSSVLWGPDYTVPALFETPYTYAEDGQPALWELPGHGWHENLLKAHNLTVTARRIVAWPSPFPAGVPLSPITTPEEEFAVNRLFIDQAVALGLPYISLIWHPWSLARFDPAMTMLKLTFAYVQELGLEATTYADEWQRLANPA
ncbi:MAG: polysaccharide deacetylase family protein [Caldilineaceae bacterium]|nr:polysaccharide deacetylase family protein [Caldilineaceae bacterium]